MMNQWDTIYDESATPAPQKYRETYSDITFGGETGFSHSNGGFGDLETNPHNYVHAGWLESKSVMGKWG